MNSADDLCQRHYAKALCLYNELRSCQDAYIRDSINNALDCLGDALRLYGPNQVLSSYNGGKDADIVMHLLRAAIAKYSFDNNSIFVPKLVYFAVEDEFPEVLEHIAFSEDIFDFQLKRYECGIIEGIKQHAEANKGTAPAFVLGTRHGDPNCGKQGTFAPSSSWMPVAFMRVNPIISWSYGQVWHFLRLFKLPYCKLYEDGYTSLGQRHNTLRNPYLRRIINTDDSSDEVYWPAYLLNEWDQERAGRISKNPSVNSNPSESTEESVTPLDNEHSDAGSAWDEPSVGLILVKTNDPYNDFDVDVQSTSRVLCEIGSQLKSVAYVENDMPEIVTEIKRMNESFDVVILSKEQSDHNGSDKVFDVVERAVAEALHKELVESTVSHGDSTACTDVDSDVENHQKPCVPKDSILHCLSLNSLSESSLTVLQCEKVYLFRTTIEEYTGNMRALAHHLLGERQKKTVTCKLVMRGERSNLKSSLEQLTSEDVKFKVDSSGAVSVLKIVSTAAKHVETAVSALLKVCREDIIRIEK